MTFDIGAIVLSIIGTGIAIFLGFVVSDVRKALEQIQRTREEYISKSDHAIVEIKNNASLSALTELLRKTREEYVHINLCSSKENKIEIAVDSLRTEMRDGFGKIHVRLDEFSKHIDWNNGKNR